MKFLQALLHPDHDEDPERALIIHAANLLQIGEFQLLQLAFERWHGREMSAAEGDRYFRLFMLEGRNLPFVLHYARQIVTLEGEGRLNDAAPQYHRYDRDYFRTPLGTGWRRFVVAATIVLGALGGGFAMASYSVEVSGKCASNLPPCITQQELEQR